MKLMRWLCLLLTVHGLPLLTAADTYDATWRYGSMPVPRLEKAPTVDGTIDPAEWSRTSLFPAPVSMDPIRAPGLPPPERTWVWMGYTAQALYVAWRQDLPEEELPVNAKATKRDSGEGSDNTVNLWLGANPTNPEIFNISGNALSNLYDRRLDGGLGTHWNPNITYKSRLLPKGWEGELEIPFKELGLEAAPADGAKWASYLYSAWRKGGDQVFAWPYVGWRMRGQTGYLVFSEKGAALRFEDAGQVKLLGGDGAKLETKLVHRKEKSKESYNQNIYTALQVSQVEGGTFQGFDKIIGDALAPFTPAAEVKAPGEYLLRYEAKAGNQVLASGVQPYFKAPPLDLDPTPFFLSAKKLIVEARAEDEQARTVEITFNPGAQKAQASFKSRRASLSFSTDKLAVGDYELTAESKDAAGKVIATASAKGTHPAPPDWWTMKEGIQPLVPPPWTAIEVSGERIEVLGRRYEFGKQALPSQITTRGKEILAGPMEIKTSEPWKKSDLKLVTKADDAAVYESAHVAGNVNLKVRTQVEFDGFMYVDLELTGSGAVDRLDLDIPFKKEHATLMQSYCKTSGPGDLDWKNPNDPANPYKAGRRFVGQMPDYALKTPPMLTTWIGTDHYGLEFSCESSRGWAMAKPNEAMEIYHVPRGERDGDQVRLKVHLISKSVPLSDKPRRIRFGLVATPTKTLLPYIAKARFYDDYTPYLLPGRWGEYPVWHPPLKNQALIEKNLKWVKQTHEMGKKLLINGGWNISAQWNEWDTWGKEMIAEPLSNVSFSECKQFAACYRTPYAAFMANSFGYNARLLGFDGIRFDTVVPSYECQSLEHDCGWRDDEGRLWPSFSLFEQREIWKRLYRIFHGGVIANGCIQTPNAAGPIMAIHSFSDHHEIGESYYMHAKTIKDGYPPDMIRAIMTGEQYGFYAESNIKGSPLYWNQRNAALLVNGAQPRFMDYRSWKVGYEAHASPAISVWNAFDWIDRWNAQFLGWWENGEMLNAECSRLAGPNVEKPMVLASLWLQKGKKALIVVTNYELEPLDDAEVKLNLAKCELKGKLYAEDAVTLESVPITAEGALKLDILGERYRLIKISNEKPAFHDDHLGPNLIAAAAAAVDKEWHSAEVKLEPNSTYVVTAQVKIDKPIGEGAANANQMTMYSPSISHGVTLTLDGAGVHGVNATNLISKCAVKGSAQWVSYAETDDYKRSYYPRYWEKTPGWMTLFLPVGTGTNATTGKVSVGLTDPGQAQVKDLSLRKVK